MTQDIRQFLLIFSWTVVVLRLPAVFVRAQRRPWLSLIAISTCVTFLQAGVAAWWNQVTGLPKLSHFTTGSLAVVLIWLQLVFARRALAATRHQSRPPERALNWWVVVTLLGMTLGYTLAVVWHLPSRDRFLPPVDQFTPVTIFWIFDIPFAVVCSILNAYCYWRLRCRVGTPLLRLGTALIAVGQIGIIVLYLSRIASLFSADTALLTTGLISSTAYFVLVAIGTSIAVVQPALRSMRNAWDCYRLHPLWRAMYDAAPHIALNPPGARWREPYRLFRAKLRLHRRMVEIRDGFLVLRGWVTVDEERQLAEKAEAMGLGEADTEAFVVAGLVRRALRHRAAGAKPPTDGLTCLGPASVDGLAELRALRRIAAAFDAQGENLPELTLVYRSRTGRR